MEDLQVLCKPCHRKDPFGIPPARPNRQVVLIPGTHSLQSSSRVAEDAADWPHDLAL
jgi:hypothetical protein